MKQKINVEFEVFASAKDLNEEDRSLVEQARLVTAKAYAPYSNFWVGAVALMDNGKRVEGTNQENASFPVGICAERTLLSSVAMLYKDMPVKAIAISYHNVNAGTKSNHPISPCGVCRQTLLEYEQRVKHPIRLLLSGMEGKVIALETASLLLPLSFDSDDMK